MSAKTVKGYLNTRFGAVLRHFNSQGVSDVSNCMLDAFVMEQRVRFERGEFSEWKWRLVRRGSKILKHFALTGTVDLAELRPWEPVLCKPRQSVELDTPTPEQLTDPDDLYAMIWRIKQELLNAGLTKLPGSIRMLQTLSVKLTLPDWTAVTERKTGICAERCNPKRRADIP